MENFIQQPYTPENASELAKQVSNIISDLETTNAQLKTLENQKQGLEKQKPHPLEERLKEYRASPDYVQPERISERIEEKLSDLESWWKSLGKKPFDEAGYNHLNEMIERLEKNRYILLHELRDIAYQNLISLDIEQLQASHVIFPEPGSEELRDGNITTYKLSLGDTGVSFVFSVFLENDMAKFELPEEVQDKDVIGYYFAIDSNYSESSQIAVYCDTDGNEIEPSDPLPQLAEFKLAAAGQKAHALRERLQQLKT